MFQILAVLTALALPSDSDLFSKLDRNQDGLVESHELNDSQRAAFRRAIRVADLDFDGKLTAAELQVALQPVQPVTVTRQRTSFDIARLDRNRDGHLTKDEIPQAFQDRFDQLFTVYGKKIPLSVVQSYRRDSSDNQKQSTSSSKEKPGSSMEMNSSASGQSRSDAGSMRQQAGRSGAFAAFRRLDRNRDGRIAQSEVSDLVWNRLKRFDKDSDNFIDRRELQATQDSRKNE